MLSFITQSAYTTTGIDLTSNLSSLLVGLVTLLMVTAGMIAFEAVRYHFAQKAEVSTEPAPATFEYLKAA
jgi:hypothetical protein